MNELRIGSAHFRALHGHLFQADGDEHGALILAGAHERHDGGLLLCAREVHLLGAEEFPAGEHGYRQLAASALARIGNRAADDGMTLVSAHSHPGSDDETGLSADDLAGHDRTFAHLLDITAAASVTGIAFGRRSAAGEVWRSGGFRQPLDRVRIVGAALDTLLPAPERPARPAAERFDRQVRLFGSEGQERLRRLHVGVIGVGGGGSILVEQLAHLGVGRLTLVDPDVVKTHNLSRIMGATEADSRVGSKKVEVAARMASAIDSSVAVRSVDGDVADIDVAEQLIDCDFLFLATDTATARLVANAITQTFLIPLVQIGAKVETRPGGEIEQIYTAVRPVLPRHGCLSCAGLIDPMQLQRESASPAERADQNYAGDAEIVDPSVTTLNAAAAAGALNVFLMAIIGQADDSLAEHRITLTREGTTLITHTVPRDDCRWCGTQGFSRYARADIRLLPCRPRVAELPPFANRPSSTSGRRAWLRLLVRRQIAVPRRRYETWSSRRRRSSGR